MNTITIDLSNVLLYLIPFMVIWILVYKWMEIFNSYERIY